jgi:hypothetical protein
MALSEVFLTGLYISGMGLLAGALAVCYKSKCRRIACCGIVIDRDVEAEEKFDELELQHRPTNDTAHDIHTL